MSDVNSIIAFLSSINPWLGIAALVAFYFLKDRIKLPTPAKPTDPAVPPESSTPILDKLKEILDKLK